MATHSNTLALKIPWTEELGAGYYPWGRKEPGTTKRLHCHFQCSTHGVTQLAVLDVRASFSPTVHRGLLLGQSGYENSNPWFGLCFTGVSLVSSMS